MSASGGLVSSGTLTLLYAEGQGAIGQAQAAATSLDLGFLHTLPFTSPLPRSAILSRLRIQLRK